MRLTLGLLLAVFGSCSSEPAPATCVPGQSIACVGANACMGFQTCSSTGTYGACECGAQKDGAIDDSPGMDATDAGTDAVDAPVDTGVDVFVDASSPPWADLFGSGDLVTVAVDSAKNVLVSGTATIVEKRDFAGNMKWRKTATNVNTYSIAVGTNDDVYVATYATGTTDFGGGMTSQGTYLVKYDAKGTFVWQWGPYATVFLSTVRTKSNGNVVAVGQFGGSTNFGGGTLTTNGYDAFLIELTPSKAYVRAKNWGGAGNQIATALSIDKNDNMFLGASFFQTIDFGGGTLTGPQAVHSVALAKLDPSAGYIAQLDLKAATNNGAIKALVNDSTGRLYVAGGLESDSTWNFGGGDIMSNGGADVALALLDSSLGHVWSKHWGDSTGEFIGGMWIDPTDAVALVGFYTGTPDFGLGNLPSALKESLFVVRFDKTGSATGNTTASITNGTVIGGGIAHIQGSDWIIAGTCGLGTLSIASKMLSCGTLNTTGFAARLAP